MRGVVYLVAFAEVAYSDCDVGHFRGKVQGKATRLKGQGSSIFFCFKICQFG